MLTNFVYTLFRVFARALGLAFLSDFFSDLLSDLALDRFFGLGLGFLRGFKGSTICLKSSRLKCIHFLNVGNIRDSDIKSCMSWSGKDMPVLNRK